MLDVLPTPIYGTITLVSGDNLGSCFLGGFKAPSQENVDIVWRLLKILLM